MKRWRLWISCIGCQLVVREVHVIEAVNSEFVLCEILS